MKNYNEQEKNLREYLEHDKKCKDNLSNVIYSFKILIKGLFFHPEDSYLYSKSKEFYNYLKKEEKEKQKGINRLEKKLGKNLEKIR